MRKISRIEPKMPELIRRKRVAAYARVSMETERLHHSLSAQVSYYSSLIQKNPEWEYAGVFADDGISGTASEKRDAFQQMLQACEEGKIDIVLTKSISRFARNTVDLLETVRHLKDLGIEVRFEKERINSMSGDGELMLTILASFAQEESRSISENVKWGTRKRFEQGIPNGKFRIFGYRWADGQLVIEPKEAKIVKRIFQNFLDGKSRLETEREFAAEGITTANGCRWCDSNIKVVLTNITYTGNLLLQKEFIEDPITKHRKKNRGELPQYFVEETHEPIIDMETFQFVQEEIQRRKELGALANKSLNITAFTGMVKCPHCGCSYMHNYRADRGNPQEFWTCGSKKIAGRRCPVKGSVPQRILEQETAAVLGLGAFDEDALHEQIDHIEVPEYRVLTFFMKDGTEVQRKWRSTAKKECWTDEYKDKQREWMKNYMAQDDTRFTPFTTRVKCGCCGNSCRRASQPSRTSPNGRVNYWRCKTASKCGTKGVREEELKSITATQLGLSDFDGAAFREQVECITVLPDFKLEFSFTDGHTQTAEFSQQKKGHAWTDEQRAKYMESTKSSYTPERRKAMSEKMKKIRSEKHWSSTGKGMKKEEGNG